jgi:MFS family permease
MLWSGATVISGGCTGFLLFIIFRSIATGMGEGCFAPSNYATIADYHDNSTRATAMSISTTAYYFGVIVSGLVAGWIGDHWGWRSPSYWLVEYCGLSSSYEAQGQIILKASKRQGYRKSKPAFKESMKFSHIPTRFPHVVFRGLIVVCRIPHVSTLHPGKVQHEQHCGRIQRRVLLAHSGFAGYLLRGASRPRRREKEAEQVLLSCIGFLFPLHYHHDGMSSNSRCVFGICGFGFWRGFSTPTSIRFSTT